MDHYLRLFGKETTCDVKQRFWGIWDIFSLVLELVVIYLHVRYYFVLRLVILDLVLEMMPSFLFFGGVLQQMPLRRAPDGGLFRVPGEQWSFYPGRALTKRRHGGFDLCVFVKSGGAYGLVGESFRSWGLPPYCFVLKDFGCPPTVGVLTR